MGPSRAARAAGVEAVRCRIEHWRRVRAKRSPMPAPLWAAAVSLAGEHGVYPIARALRLNYETLKARVGRSAAVEHTDGVRSAGFVAFDGSQLIGAAPPVGSVVELSGADGAKLVVRLAGREVLDVLRLAEAFWRRA